MASPSAFARSTLSLCHVLYFFSAKKAVKLLTFSMKDEWS